MLIQVATLNTPLFSHAGLELSEAWSDVDLVAAKPETLVALETYVGTHVQVHPAHGATFDAWKKSRTAPASTDGGDKKTKK